jgi:hypothetical protein
MSSCVNCCRVFDSSKQNFLLSTAWFVRKKDITDAQYLIDHLGASKEEADFVIKHVADGCCSHQEFLPIIKNTLSALDH